MTLSDTAEYWQDVKSHFANKRTKRVFTHKTGIDCGHFHVNETSKNKNVDCYACLEIIKTNHENYLKSHNNEADSKH